MISVSLEEMACSGSFGPIRIGDPSSKLIEAFGQPHDWGGLPGRVSKSYDAQRARTLDPAALTALASEYIEQAGIRGILKWGSIEFHFENAALCLIHFEFMSGDLNAGGLVNLDSWIIREDLSRTELTQSLTNARIAFSSSSMTDNPCDWSVKTDGGVTFRFDESEPEPFQCCSFSVSVGPHEH